MKWYHQALIALFVVCLAGGLIWSANHYHSKYETEKTRADKAVELVKLQQTTIENMQVRQRDVAALDARYTGELADAKATIESLRSDVATGKRRLQLKASCPKSGTSAPGVDDATSPRLTNSAERDYFTLRYRIETATKQIAGLQEYIKLVCK